jgi:endonuclease/exonuclease/phosphatase family metal-dependent hydrolase
MPDLNKLTHRAMRSLVQGFGCYDAVAEVLNARWGCGSSKGTISKKMSGQLDWTMADVIALQDAAGEYPITRILARQHEEQPNGVISCLVSHTGVIAKEFGEATNAILAAAQSSCADKRAQAATEIDQAIAALQQGREKVLEGSRKFEPIVEGR